MTRREKPPPGSPAYEEWLAGLEWAAEDRAEPDYGDASGWEYATAEDAAVAPFWGETS